MSLNFQNSFAHLAEQLAKSRIPGKVNPYCHRVDEKSDQVFYLDFIPVRNRNPYRYIFLIRVAI